MTEVEKFDVFVFWLFMVILGTLAAEVVLELA